MSDTEQSQDLARLARVGHGRELAGNTYWPDGPVREHRSTEMGSDMEFLVRARRGLVALLTLLLLVAVPSTATAGSKQPPGKDKRQLTVMTQNLYLGSSLTPAIEAENAAEFIGAVAQIYGTAVATNFPRRAKAIADTIAAEKPDLVGLQEVTEWIAQRTGPRPDLPDLPSYDFLLILQRELAERGLDYSVGAVSQNADIGPAPLAGYAGCSVPTNPATWVPDCFVTLKDRDVILVNDETPGLDVLRSGSGDYQTQEVLKPPVGAPVSFARGWALIDGTFEGKKFRFVNTHLEVEDFRATQEAQAREFLAGPAKAPGAVIATGDFNSAADPATTENPTATYAALTRSWFDDAWAVNGGDPGLTCCQNSSLTNTQSQLRTRIDLILLHGPVRAREAQVVGDAPILADKPPWWASDHAGVVATLRLH
jgi:endonuclease/exonuclease/phosphatase family metal-dependent hydrolase